MTAIGVEQQTKSTTMEMETSTRVLSSLFCSRDLNLLFSGTDDTGLGVRAEETGLREALGTCSSLTIVRNLLTIRVFKMARSRMGATLHKISKTTT